MCITDLPCFCFIVDHGPVKKRSSAGHEQPLIVDLGMKRIIQEYGKKPRLWEALINLRKLERWSSLNGRPYRAVARPAHVLTWFFLLDQTSRCQTHVWAGCCGLPIPISYTADAGEGC